MSQVPKRGRHLLTLADRKRGCAVARGRRGGKKAQASGNAHKLTREERRRGGLATAAKRREERERALVTLALPAQRGSESPSPQAQKFAELMESDLSGPRLESYRRTREIVGAVLDAEDARALGASLADKLMEGHHHVGDGTVLHPLSECRPGRCWTDEPGADLDPKLPSCDPFTLSALKRFLPGPRSPLSLTRSQRAHVDLMIKDGWLMATGDSMLALTEKGRQAIETEEVDHV